MKRRVGGWKEAGDGRCSYIIDTVSSEVAMNDVFLFIYIIWSSVCQFGKGVISVGQYASQLGDKILNDPIAIVVQWILQILILAGAIVGAAIIIIVLGKRVARMYWENYWDTVSVIVTVFSVAVVVYFGDQIRPVMEINLVVFVIIMGTVYVGLRTNVVGYKRARAYY